MSEKIKEKNNFQFIRGATTATGNSVEEIENAVVELIDELIVRNNLKKNQLLIGSLDIDTSSHLYERIWDLSICLWVCCVFFKRTKCTAQAKHRMSPDSSFHHRQLFPQIKRTPLQPSKPSPSQALSRLFNIIKNCLKKLQKHICYLV